MENYQTTMLDKIDRFYQTLFLEMEMCKINGKGVQYHHHLKQLLQILAFLTPNNFFWLDIKYQLIFCSSLQSCFSILYHILTEVIFQVNEIHYSENCFVEFSTNK